MTEAGTKGGAGSPQTSLSLERHAIHDVLNSPGQALGEPTLSFMQSRFAHDFSAVRIHKDRDAADSAQTVGARAYTVGQHIVFDGDAYAPGTIQGRHLLAHELTHVVQQERSSAGLNGSEEQLEEEARRVSCDGESPSAAAVKHKARPGSTQLSPVKVRGRTFEVGDIHLNPLASVDVRKKGVLFPGPDQAHILVTGDGKLGYEVSHTAPDDPFRWERLKEIVDNGHADIKAIGIKDRFLVKEVTGSTARIVETSLGELFTKLGVMAGGITLPRLSTQKIHPGKPVLIASANDSRDSIFYESGAKGSGLFANALAHELFGHLWLAMRGVPWEHSGELTASRGVRDPLGRPFTGPVTSYIDRFAGESISALKSPTQGVSASGLASALKWLVSDGAKNLSFSKNENVSRWTDVLGLRWEIISGNYDVLLSGPQPAAVTPTRDKAVSPQSAAVKPTLDDAAGVRGKIVAWYGTLDATQQSAFRIGLENITWDLARRKQLAIDVLKQLPRNPRAKTP